MGQGTSRTTGWRTPRVPHTASPSTFLLRPLLEPRDRGEQGRPTTGVQGTGGAGAPYYRSPGNRGTRGTRSTPLPEPCSDLLTL